MDKANFKLNLELIYKTKLKLVIKYTRANQISKFTIQSVQYNLWKDLIILYSQTQLRKWEFILNGQNVQYKNG